MDFGDYQYNIGSQDSLHSNSQYRMYTPPVTKPKNNVFFNSDDSLYKKELKRLTIPRIEIEGEPSEPEFKLQITDFSEPYPRDVTFEYKEEFTPLGHVVDTPSKNKTFQQQRSYSLDVKDIPYIDVEDCDAYLTIGNNSKKLKQISSSLQDISSSTSSINTIVHESNLDLSQIDAEIKQKYWKSPDEIRQQKNEPNPPEDFDEKRNILYAVSVPNLMEDISDDLPKKLSNRTRSAGELNSKLSEHEVHYLMRLLQDWSVNGSKGVNPEDLEFEESEKQLRKNIVDNSFKDTEFTDVRNNKSVRFSKEDLSCKFCKKESKEKKRNLSSEDYKKFYSTNLKKVDKMYHSEPDLSPKTRSKLVRDNLIYVAKYKSESDVNRNQNSDLDIMHKCQYRNCIFNSSFFPGPNCNNNNVVNATPTNKIVTEENKPIVEKKLKSILKLSNENLTTDQNRGPIFLKSTVRRHSEIFESKPINNNLIKYGSLERLTSNADQIRKKFPESYVITRNKNKPKNDINDNFESSSPSQRRNKTKVIVLRRKYYPKMWKSCSDIKYRQRIVKKCCRNAKTTCPILKTSAEAKRRTRSCADVSFDEDDDAFAATKYESCERKTCLISRCCTTRVTAHRNFSV